MIFKKIVFIIIIIILSFKIGTAFDLNSLIGNSPIITINNDEKGKLKLITVYSIADAPFEIIWNTILEIKSYKEFTPRIKEIKNISQTDKENEITADFEIEVPFLNLEYRLIYKYDKQKRTIDVRRLSGDLEGSHWSWKFEEMGDKTFIVYSGLIKNYSSLLENIDDSTNSVTMGVNISTILSTVKLNKERAEFLYKNKQADENFIGK